MARRPTLALAATLLAAVPLAGQPPAGTAPIGELLAAHGIRLLDPPPPAPEFTLPRIGGGEGSLSERHGDWVLLTFFATWCGPCREEMPTLERLHRERGAGGLSVLAVSVDASPDPVAPFADRLGLTLPLYWDRDGAVGAVWDAGSIPVSYLIDPAGGVVGAARGARDWTAAGPLFDALAAAAPAAVDAPPRYAASDRLELPGVADPPTAEWSLPAGTLRPERPFTLEVRLRWSGRLEDYLPQPPRLTLPAGVTQGPVAATSSSRDASHLVRYAIELTAAEPGLYALDPIELSYLPALGRGPMAERVAGPTIEVTGAALAPRLALPAALVLAALAVAGAWAWRRRRRAAGPPPATAPWERLRGELDRARALRLAGDRAAAYERLAAAAGELGPTGEHDDLERGLEAVRFGGRLPGAGELEAIERRLERALSELEPDPEEPRRRALRLRRSPTTPKESPG